MRNLLLLTALLGLLAWSGCKKPCEDPTDPDCENYDPCYVANPLSPDFSIEEVVGITLKASFFTDTVLANGFSSVRFTAMHGYQSYSWQIGTDDREFTDRVVSLQFIDPIGTISVRLIAKKYDWQLDPICRPGDDGLDTMVRQLTVVKRKETRVEGTYFGRVERKNGVSDTLTVKVDWRTPDSVLFPNGMVSIDNFPRGCVDDTPYGSYQDVFYGYTGFSYVGGTYPDTCFRIRAIGEVHAGRDSLLVAYTLMQDRSDTLTFRGRRVR